MDEFYGVDGVCVQCKEHQTDAGNPLDEESDSDIMPTANHQQEQHMHHETVQVLMHQCPFSDPEYDEAAFFMILHQVISHRIIPNGFGLMAERGCSDPGLLFETLSVG